MKIGDYIATGYPSAGVTLHKIVRETPTLWITSFEVKFRKKDLRILGPYMWGTYAGRIPTEDDLMFVRIQRAYAKLRKLVVTADNIEAVEALLQGNKA